MEDNSKKLEILHSYIKDLSLETLDPLALINKNNEENFNVSISPLNIKYRKLNENIYEVISECKILTEYDKTKIFALDLQYGGIFSINCDDTELNKVLYVDCAQILYPFLRTYISNLSISSGGAPLLLPFIDFNEQFKNIDTSANLGEEN